MSLSSVKTPGPNGWLTTEIVDRERVAEQVAASWNRAEHLVPRAAEASAEAVFFTYSLIKPLFGS